MGDINSSASILPRHDARSRNGDMSRMRDTRTRDVPGPARMPYRTHFISIYYFIIFATILNFFLTENPYATSHNLFGMQSTDNYFILPPRIIGFALLIYFAAFRYV